MLTQKDYCDFNTSVALKELGLTQECGLAFYYPDGDFVRDYMLRHFLVNEIYAPTLWKAQQWLRERKKLHVEVSIFANNYDVEIISTKGDKHGYHNVFIEKCGFKSYEEALLEGIKEAIKILKDERVN